MKKAKDIFIISSRVLSRSVYKGILEDNGYDVEVFDCEDTFIKNKVLSGITDKEAFVVLDPTKTTVESFRKFALRLKEDKSNLRIVVLKPPDFVREAIRLNDVFKKPLFDFVQFDLAEIADDFKRAVTKFGKTVNE